MYKCQRFCNAVREIVSGSSRSFGDISLLVYHLTCLIGLVRMPSTLSLVVGIFGNSLVAMALGSVLSSLNMRRWYSGWVLISSSARKEFSRVVTRWTSKSNNASDISGSATRPSSGRQPPLHKFWRILPPYWLFSLNFLLGLASK